jgi:uncharacterized protein YfbU (UPF0304 family)
MIMMRDLYKHLKVTRGEIDPDFVAEVIWGGHYWAPLWEMQGLFHDHADKRRDVRFVVDVLDMWSFMEEAFEKLPKQEKERIAKECAPFGKQVQFPGFDGNDEASLMGIAHFLTEHMNRFTRFKGRGFNAHMPTIATYRRMLGAFEPIRKTLIGHGLSADQIITLLKTKMQRAKRPCNKLGFGVILTAQVDTQKF